MAVENNATKNITDVPDKELCTGAEQVIVNDAGKMVMMPVENVHAIADCAKADATQAGFIANRPFYESEPESTLIASYDASTAWMYSAVGNPDDDPEFPFECAVAYGVNIGVIPELRRGQKYTVIFDGEEYCGTTISCYDSIMLGSNRNLKLFIGDEGGIAEDDDIPFGIVIAQYGGVAEIYVVYYNSTTFNHSIALFADITNVQTIDYKYFPDGYPYIEQEPVLICEYVGSFDNEYGYVEAPNLLRYELNVDSVITLTIDGVSTTFTVKDMHFYEELGYIGNGALIPGDEGPADTGEDFCVIIHNSYTIMAIRDKKNEHAVSISGYKPVYHKIDSRLVGVNMSEYLTKREGDETYLSSGASSQYYTQYDMSNNYIQKGQLNNLIKPTNMANTYMTKDDMASQYLSRTAGDARYLPKYPSPFITSYEMARDYRQINTWGACHNWNSTDTSSYQYINNRPTLTSRKQLDAFTAGGIIKNSMRFMVSELVHIGYTSKLETCYIRYATHSADHKMACGWIQSSNVWNLWTLCADADAPIKSTLEVSPSDSPSERRACVDASTHSLYFADGTLLRRYDAYTGEVINTLDFSEYARIEHIAVSPLGDILAVSLNNVDKKLLYSVNIYKVTDEGYALLKTLNGTTEYENESYVTQSSGHYPKLYFNPAGTKLVVISASLVGGGGIYNITDDSIPEMYNFGIPRGRYGYYDNNVFASGNAIGDFRFSGDGDLCYAKAGTGTKLKKYDLSQGKLDFICELQGFKSGAISSGRGFQVYKDLIIAYRDLYKIKGDKVIYIASSDYSFRFNGIAMSDKGVGLGFLESDSATFSDVYAIREGGRLCYTSLDDVKDYDQYTIVVNNTSTYNNYRITFDCIETIDKNAPIDGMILKSCTPGSNKKFRISIGSDGQLTTTEYIE